MVLDGTRWRNSNSFPFIAKFQQNRYQLMDYMSSKQLPTNIQARLLNYYDFRLQKQLYKESEVNEIMGPKVC